MIIALSVAALAAFAAGVKVGRYTMQVHVAQRDADVEVLETALQAARKERDESAESLRQTQDRIGRLTRAHDEMAGRLAEAEKRAAANIPAGQGADALKKAFS